MSFERSEKGEKSVKGGERGKEFQSNRPSDSLRISEFIFQSCPPAAGKGN